MENPYRTPADIEGADDDRPLPPAPLADYLEALRREHADLPFVFQPFPVTTVSARSNGEPALQTIQISVRPQRAGRLRGVLFEPRCAGALYLRDLQVGHESCFMAYGDIPCELLTLNSASTPEALARLNPIEWQIGHGIEIDLVVRAPCEIAGVLVCDATMQEPWILRELHAKLRHYERRAADDVRLLAALTREVQELRRDGGARSRTEPAPAPVESDEGGAWMTPTDES